MLTLLFILLAIIVIAIVIVIGAAIIYCLPVLFILFIVWLYMRSVYIYIYNTSAKKLSPIMEVIQWY